MNRLTHERSNGIKTGYWSPNKKDELVARLAEYENTGLTPVEIAKLQQHKGNTNADRIRSMSDEDLALNIMCPYQREDCEGTNCYQCSLEWLREDAEK